MPSDILHKLLLLTMVIPLLGGLSVALLPRNQAGMVKYSACFFSLVTFLVSLAVACKFDWNDTSIQAGGFVPWITGLALQLRFGIDAISLWLILLTTFLCLVVIVGSTKAVTFRTKEFFTWLLLLEAAMVGAFIARDLIFFYLCFEFTLIPIFFLVGVHGAEDRLKAAKVFFIYTFAGSLLTFAGILYVAWWHFIHNPSVGWTFSFSQLIAAGQMMSTTQQTWVLLALLAGFAVKVPLFPFHTWQALTYSQAPTAASALLAGVVLKLATYALVRIALPMAPLAAVKLAPTIAVLAVIGILFAALVAWVQKDMKKVIAYSSMSHMGFAVLGMFALNLTGLTGSVAYMVNHGLSTAALFLCVGILIERFNTRQLHDLSGLARVMPVWAFFTVFFVFSSVGLPGLNGFVGEFLTLLGAITNRDLLGLGFAATAGVGMILAAIYLLYFTGKVVFGPLKLPELTAEGIAFTRDRVRDLSLREIAVLTPVAACCLWLGLYPQPLLSTLEAPLKEIAQVTERAQAEYLAQQAGPSVRVATLALDPQPTPVAPAAMEKVQ